MDSIYGFQSNIVVVRSLFPRSFLRAFDFFFHPSALQCQRSANPNISAIKVSRSSMIVQSSGTILLSKGRNGEDEAYDVTGHLH